MSDPNDFNNYQISHPGGKTSQSNEKPKLFINSGNKTVADPNGKGVYRHDANSCASWAIPVLAGQYVLACEADPNMTPEKFIQLAHETATTIKSTTREHDENGGVDFSRRTDYEVNCKIINMEALIKRIQSNKN